MSSTISAPRPTRGNAPSHSPPDTLYAPGAGLARFLGWFSIALGVAEVAAPRKMAKLTGVCHPGLLRAFGLREIATGIAILNNPRPIGSMWGRVAGDALDLAVLGSAIVTGPRRRRALASALAVGGVAALDAACAAQMSAAAALEG